MYLSLRSIEFVMCESPLNFYLKITLSICDDSKRIDQIRKSQNTNAMQLSRCPGRVLGALGAGCCANDATHMLFKRESP